MTSSWEDGALRDFGSLTPSGLRRPPSATHAFVALSGLAGFIVALAILFEARPFSNTIASAFFLLTTVAGCVFAVDLIWGKAYRRPSAGLDVSRWRPSAARAMVKFIGLLASVGFVAGLYALFPEYYGSFYTRYFEAMKWLAPVVLTLAIPYIFCVDALMIAPEDGLWQFGAFVLLRFREVDFAKLWQHLLSWLVKGFFLALMFSYLCQDLDTFLASPALEFDNYKSLYDFSYTSIYFVDISFTTAGYIFSLRLTDTHFRSTEPTFLGWAVALVCYEPFWSLIGTNYLAYDPGHPWGDILQDHPIFYDVWGSVILALVALYAWATVIFGCRFSNLTHRGIITNGPYRFTKHPAYISKNLSWWLISLPFLSGGGAQALQGSVLLLMLNGVYAMRAWTEERHLSQDPTYAAYARWIEEHGVFRSLGRARAKAAAYLARPTLRASSGKPAAAEPQEAASIDRNVV